MIPTNNRSEEPGIEQIAKLCMDSPGYLTFSAVLTARKDKHGRPLIDFYYRRYHFALEDSNQAAAALRSFIDKEIEDLIKKHSEEIGGGDYAEGDGEKP